MAAAEVFVTLLGGYALIGLLFAVAFVTLGLHRVDPTAVSGRVSITRPARLLLLPGAMLLWPLLAVRWFARAAGGRR